MGYDISDYKDIDPRYGSLKDVDELIAGLKARDMRLMMDLGMCTAFSLEV